MSTRAGTLLAVILGSAIVFLDGTIVNVAVETIGRELPATFVGRVEGLTYVNSGYLAVLAALLILAGGISDFYGRRRMFRIGLAGFGVASVACGLAPNMELLILARLVQGAFGALLVPGSLSIITATFEGEERGRAIGLWAAGTSATLILGPFLGGFLVQSISWRAAFLINVPLVLVALWATSAVLESRDDEAQGRFDWLGAAVIAIAVGGLAFGATRGAERQWQDTVAFISLGIGAVALVAFPFLMRMSANPLVPMSLFSSRNFTVVNISTFVIYGALYVTLIFQSLYLQGTLGYSPIAAGAIGLPVGLLLTFLSTPAGQLAGRFGPRLFLTVGPMIMGLGLLWLARIPADSEAWIADLGMPATLIPPGDALVDVVLALVVFGLGISLLVAPLTTALMSSVPVRRAGLGSAINNAVSRVGAPLMSAVLFIAITASFYPLLAERVPGLTADDARAQQIQPLTSVPEGTDPALAAAVVEASTDAFHLAMFVSA
ncbi:MAG: MFS transporter, partial [Candidatus Limnocylindria bacterium]